MICVAPPSDQTPRPARTPYRVNHEHPLWFVRTTRAASEWARCDAGRRLEADTADLLLDHVFEQLAVGDIEDGVACLIDGLTHLCECTERGCWRRFTRETWSTHPLSSLVWQSQIREVIGRHARANHGFAALVSLVGPDLFMPDRRTATPIRRAAR